MPPVPQRRRHIFLTTAQDIGDVGQLLCQNLPDGVGRQGHQDGQAKRDVRHVPGDQGTGDVWI